MGIFFLKPKNKEKNMLTKKQAIKISRRELRKISVLLILVILFLTSSLVSASITDKAYEYSYFTDDYNSLLKSFPIDSEINIHLSNIKQSNSIYIPLISYNIGYYSEPINLVIPEGLLEYTPLTVLFEIDSNKSTGSYAPFLPTESYSSYCKPVINYLKNNPIITKADLINRNKEYLIKNMGFSRACLDELIEKKWIYEKQILGKITYIPKDFKNQEQIINTVITFPATVLSKSVQIPLNIIKVDSAVVYAYPNPMTYSDLILYVNEKGWKLSNNILFDTQSFDVSEIYSLNLNQGEYGSFILSLNNYNNNFADFKLKYLNQDKNINFNDFFTSSYVTLKNNNSKLDIISNLSFDNNYLILNNYELSSINEKRIKKINFNSSLDYNKRIYSRKEYNLYQTPYFDTNNFLLSLNNGYVLNPIIKDNLYLFYNSDNNIVGKMDLYLINSLQDAYYFSESTADYNLKTYKYKLSNEYVTIKEINTSEEKTSIQILFKDDNIPIIITTDRKNMIMSTDPNFYIYKDYLITFASEELKISKINKPSSSLKTNFSQNYSNKFNLLVGNKLILDNSKSNVIDSNKLYSFNSYIYDISTAHDFSSNEQKLFWASSFNDANFENGLNIWYDDNVLCDSNKVYDNYSLLNNYFKSLDFTVLKYPGSFSYPFSNVLKDTQNYIIPKNTFSIDNYRLLCDYKKNNELSNYSSIIFNSGLYLKDKNNFIENLTFFTIPINKIYLNQVYNIKYMNDYFTSSKEGIVFFDENYVITTGRPLDFKNNLSSSIDILDNYLIFNRLSIPNVNYLIFDISNKTNDDLIKGYIEKNYISQKEKLSVKFKLPKRESYFNDSYIYKMYLLSTKENRFKGNCTYLSMHTASNYNYNDIKNKFSNNDWWISDYRPEDAWFLGKENQVIWNYKKDLPLNNDRLFEGMILGIYVGRTDYTYKTGERAGKTYTVQYTHSTPYIDIYKNETKSILNASFFVTIENGPEYYNGSSRELREIIMPKGYYDDSIKDKYGKTEFDYVKEYLTSFD